MTEDERKEIESLLLMLCSMREMRSRVKAAIDILERESGGCAGCNSYVDGGYACENACDCIRVNPKEDLYTPKEAGK